ncbi:hypothetical protein NKI13_24555 [Mesorhizobium australicum]|uniref:A1S_2505 family phage non-structural protein n=1 Tax=Mesorhizobium australicum TaxID=536018 RepID=UPI00333711B4
MNEPVFVFGSNMAGRHGAGAALWAAKNRGAVYGKGWGRQGNSYAIPTKDANIKTLPLWDIEVWVGKFLMHARQHPAMTFQLTPIGCGLAGYHPGDIAPIFRDAPANVIMPPEFVAALSPAGEK